MRAYHNSRDNICRCPFGALKTGEKVRLSIIINDSDPEVSLRTWIDGVGEEIYPMDKEYRGDGVYFSAELPAEVPCILWYSFIIRFWDEYGNERYLRYGAREGKTGGEGALYDGEPPSFQITVYSERKVPDWYKNAIVYQIFPDRFARGENWKEGFAEHVSGHSAGPAQRICEDWDTVPFYEKDEKGRVTTWEFYGGTLKGITEKLGYLKEAGITCLYLNPVFDAASNHRYDTGDYMRIDPILGGEEAFDELIAAADEQGISIILDGVFNHTGCDSIYFNKYGNYDSKGAFGNEDSPYRNWYTFNDTEAGYECWWGVDDLPNVNEDDPSYKEFIYGAPDSVVRHYLKKGVKGFRLDVADELPDRFIEGIKKAVTETRDDGVLIGEVWEDASNKISYGILRKYFLGRELDGVMNYPLLDGLHAFARGRMSAYDLCETLITLKENYPEEALYSCLNLMGSHDRPRLMTLMGDAPEEKHLSEKERKDFRLSPEQKKTALGRVWIVTLMQMTLPGVPSIYYGDEAGLEGYSDPYNRGSYPWGHEDPDTKAVFRNAVSLRRMFPAFTKGSFEPFACNDDVFGYFRSLEDEHLAVLVNASKERTHTVSIPSKGEDPEELIGGAVLVNENGHTTLTLAPFGSAVIRYADNKGLAARMEPGKGVLMHITSLPDGHIGKDAYAFADILAEAGVRYWQILPLNPTDEYGSPYAGASAFAGNISLLSGSEEELRNDFKALTDEGVLKDYIKKNESWVLYYAAFNALRKKFGNVPCTEWPEEYRHYSAGLLEEDDIKDDIMFNEYCQYRFDEEWSALKRYANDRGIKIIGDMPIYVSYDSADAWAEPQLFTVDESGNSTLGAGVPPDYFSEEGQLWGNPLYNWDELGKSGFSWWKERFRRMFFLYDHTRIDHFRGFESYWAVPAGKKATEGRWLYGPGVELFKKVYDDLGPLPVMAEDLGVITPAVRGLLDQCGFKGMDVVQFADCDPLEGYAAPKGKVVYSGTHDNQTLLGWCKEKYPDADPRECAEKIMENIDNSGADIIIKPVQDIMGLGDEARMNVPGTSGNNWQWRLTREQFEALASGGLYSL